MSSQREDLDEFDLGKERENDNWLSEYEDTWDKENTITTPGFDENGAPVLGDYVFGELPPEKICKYVNKLLLPSFTRTQQQVPRCSSVLFPLRASKKSSSLFRFINRSCAHD